MKLLFKNATVFPITFKSFKGDVLVKDSKIYKVGESIKKDEDTEVIDLAGKYLFPGFIDAHSHIGLKEESVNDPVGSDVNEMTDPITADVKAIDGFNPEDPAIDRALSGGVTTVMIVPGSGNTVGGQGAIIKFKSKIVDEMIVKEPAGLKMAFGENPKRVYGDQKKTPSQGLG
ncbi:MAG: amidohydrolase family protein, partial [Thermotogae bacterium]|nr:amidohydrolase family protein [Thermotogota bacterium]